MGFFFSISVTLKVLSLINFNLALATFVHGAPTKEPTKATSQFTTLAKVTQTSDQPAPNNEPGQQTSKEDSQLDGVASMNTDLAKEEQSDESENQNWDSPKTEENPTTTSSKTSTIKTTTTAKVLISQVEENSEAQGTEDEHSESDEAEKSDENTKPAKPISKPDEVNTDDEDLTSVSEQDQSNTETIDKDAENAAKETSTKSTLATTASSSTAEEMLESEKTPENNDQSNQEKKDDESEVLDDIKIEDETTHVIKTNEFSNPTMDTDVQKPLAVS